ncbi:hypothetical protein VT84_33790 [Gemmata sp. SH-PL17]|nr:hypothetical protein VT84_33790 [Gemmata sp. SH-PL17]
MFGTGARFSACDCTRAEHTPNNESGSGRQSRTEKRLRNDGRSEILDGPAGLAPGVLVDGRLRVETVRRAGRGRGAPHGVPFSRTVTRVVVMQPPGRAPVVKAGTRSGGVLLWVDKRAGLPDSTLPCARMGRHRGEIAAVIISSRRTRTPGTHFQDHFLFRNVSAGLSQRSSRPLTGADKMGIRSPPPDSP